MKVDAGEWFTKSLVDIHSGDSSFHTLLANIYAPANRWEDVMEVRDCVRERMGALGVWKEPGCSSMRLMEKSTSF